MKTIKIGNVIFYKIYEHGGRKNDVWLTHDGRYGIFREKIGNKRSECAVAVNEGEPVEPTNPNGYEHWKLTRCVEQDFPNSRSAMQYICEHFYWESKN